MERSAKRGSPRKRREDPLLLVEGIVTSGLNVQSVHVRRRRRDRKTGLPARLPLPTPPRGIETKLFFLLVELRDASSRVCARIPEDLHQSSRESRLICKCWESPLNDSVHSFRLDYFQGDAIAGCRCFFFRRDSRNILFGRYSRSF